MILCAMHFPRAVLINCWSALLALPVASSGPGSLQRQHWQDGLIQKLLQGQSIYLESTIVQCTGEWRRVWHLIGSRPAEQAAPAARSGTLDATGLPSDAHAQRIACRSEAGSSGASSAWPRTNKGVRCKLCNVLSYVEGRECTCHNACNSTAPSN